MRRIAVLALLAVSQIAFAQKTSRDLPKSGSAVDVIVRFTRPPTKNDLKLLGPYGQVKKMLDVINAVHIALTPAQIQALASEPSIAYISPDRKTTGALDITTSAVSAQLA